MIIRPMIGEVEVPSIERVATTESRRLATIGVPGLAGDLTHDLGSASLAVEIIGSLAGDEAREDFLGALRPPFQAGEPVDFVADITTATELEQVLIERLDVDEVNQAAGGFRYRIVLRQHVEPPAPPPAVDDFGLDLGILDEIDDLAGGLLDGLELPDLLGAVPDIADPLPPLMAALDGVRQATAGLADLLTPLHDALGTGG